MSVAGETKRTERFCAYCLKKGCRCLYRAGRRGEVFTTARNTTAQSTMGEMRNALAENFGRTSDDTPGMWQISFTRLDQKMLDAALAKAQKETH